MIGDNDNTSDTGHALIALLRERRTISRFKSQDVPTAAIDSAIESARWAPNHYLTEPWMFYKLGPQAIAATVEMMRVIGTERRNEELGERKARRAQRVPAWVVVTVKRSEDAVTQREDYAAVSCAIHNFSLDLWAQGIGLKWCTGPVVDDQRYYQHLGIESGAEQIVGVLRIGYPEVVPVQKRKATEEIVRELP